VVRTDGGRLLSLALGGVGIALVLSATSSRAAGDRALPRPAPTSPFPGGLSPQWLNAADVDARGCLERLATEGVRPARYRALAPQARPDRKGCGMPQGVTVFRGPTGITYSPPLTVDCSFALELAAMEAIFQDEARRELGDSVREIDDLGGYACVARAGPYTTRYATKPAISEHSFGLAYDLRALITSKGRVVTVERDYEKGTSEPQKPAGRFLLACADRLRRETALTHVLTPDFNADHRNHFHLDRGLPFGWWWDDAPPPAAREGAPPSPASAPGLSERGGLGGGGAALLGGPSMEAELQSGLRPRAAATRHRPAPTHAEEPRE